MTFYVLTEKAWQFDFHIVSCSELLILDFPSILNSNRQHIWSKCPKILNRQHKSVKLKEKKKKTQSGSLHTSGSLLGSTSCYIKGGRTQINYQFSELRKQKSGVMILVCGRYKPTRRSWKWEINRNTEIINLPHICLTTKLHMSVGNSRKLNQNESQGRLENLQTFNMFLSSHTDWEAERKNIIALRSLSMQSLCPNQWLSTQLHRCRSYL